jgi:hypothetical protein
VKAEGRAVEKLNAENLNQVSLFSGGVDGKAEIGMGKTEKWKLAVSY